MGTASFLLLAGNLVHDRYPAYRKDLQVYAELVNESGRVIASKTETLENEVRKAFYGNIWDYGYLSMVWKEENFLFNNVPAEEINGMGTGDKTGYTPGGCGLTVRCHRRKDRPGKF
jgi:hypothetical protein